jgi:cation-transporting ATPase 13A2
MLFIYTSLQNIITCLCFSISKPFRKPVWSNPLYLTSVILLLAYNVYLVFHFDPWSQDFFTLVELPMHYRILLFVAFLWNFFLSYVFEKFFVAWLYKWWIQSRKQIAETRRELIFDQFYA